MSLNPRLQNLMDSHWVRYEIVRHAETVTANQAALVTHVGGRHVAKAVVVRDQTRSDFMVVLPAALHLDRDQLHRVTGRPGVKLEDEMELARLFPDCDLGAMPPIGHLYGLTTYVDPCLFEGQDEIWFQGGNHHELVRMTVADFKKIARPFHQSACLHREAVSVAGSSVASGAARRT